MKPNFLSYSAAVLLAGLGLGNFATQPSDNPEPQQPITVFATPKNSGSITVKSNSKNTVDFYLFDVEGKMIYRTGLALMEKQTVTGLVKGTYVYNAFCNDRPLKEGQVVLP